MLLHSRNPLPAKGTESEFRRDLPAAFRTEGVRLILKRSCLRSSRLIKNASTAIAFEKVFSPLNRDEGNEEKADVMVEPFEPRRRQTTVRTGPRLIIHFYFSGLDSTDENEGASPPDRSIRHDGK
jgi:hypothetical protein